MRITPPQAAVRFCRRRPDVPLYRALEVLQNLGYVPRVRVRNGYPVVEFWLPPS